MVRSVWSSPLILKVSREDAEVDYVQQSVFDDHVSQNTQDFEGLGGRVDQVETSAADFQTETEAKFQELEARIDQLSIPDDAHIRTIVGEELVERMPGYLRPIWAWIGMLVIAQLGFGILLLAHMFTHRKITTNAQFRRRSARVLAQELRADAPAEWIEADLVPSEDWIKEMQGYAIEEGKTDAPG